LSERARSGADRILCGEPDADLTAGLRSDPQAAPAATPEFWARWRAGWTRGRSPGFVTAMRPYFRQVAGLLVVGSAAGIVMNVAVVLPAVLLGRAIDVVLAVQRGEADAGDVAWAAALLVLGTAATELPRIGKRYWLGVARARIRANVRADALRGVLGWPADRVHTTSVGEIMARVIGDVEVLGTGVGEVIVETWDTLLFSLALVTVMLLYDPTLGLLALAPVPVALLLARFSGRWVNSRTLRARQSDADVTTFVQEGLVALRLLRTSGAGSTYARRLRRLAERRAEAELAATRLESSLAPVYGILSTAGVLAVISVGGQRVASGALSVGSLVAFLQLFVRFTGRAHRIPVMLNRVQAAAAAWSRLEPLLAAPPPLAAEPPRSSWAVDRVAGQRADEPPRRGKRHRPPARVVLDDVVFTYPGARSPALRGVSVTLAPGGLLAVTGPVGAGKSALARVVTGLFPVDAGRVRVDGQDPHHWTPADRADVGYLPQGSPVFSGTVAENVLLAPGGVAATDALHTALRVAALEGDVAEMPAGVRTEIGELGVRISGGQRQRVALARALAAPPGWPRLLVLDDPFSAVDVDTEARIIAALREHVGPDAPPERRATIVLSSTRLAAFPDADEVLVLDAGRVAERGTHADLLAADGLYALLARSHRAAVSDVR
jgi:ATP-binding cassette subfamily B multidrug efflux pump